MPIFVVETESPQVAIVPLDDDSVTTAELVGGYPTPAAAALAILSRGGFYLELVRLMELADMPPEAICAVLDAGEDRSVSDAQRALAARRRRNAAGPADDPPADDDGDDDLDTPLHDPAELRRPVPAAGDGADPAVWLWFGAALVGAALAVAVLKALL